MADASDLILQKRKWIMETVAKTGIVDDSATFLKGMEALLSQYPQFKLVAKFCSGEELLQYEDLQGLDLLLMDIEMPELDGFETAVRIEFLHRHIKKIAISMYDDKVYLDKLVSSGFRGFVSKTRVAEDLYEVVTRVLNNELVFPGRK